MQVLDCGKSVMLWLSKSDIRKWADSSPRWPCSMLKGHRLLAEFDSNGLAALAIDGRDRYDGNSNALRAELSAVCADLLKESGEIKPDHPVWHVVIGQFLTKETR